MIVVVAGPNPAAVAVAQEVVRQGGEAVLLSTEARSCALRQPCGITTIASRLVGVKGAPGRMVAVVEDGEVECGAIVVVGGLEVAPRSGVPLTTLLDAPLPEGTVVLDLRGGPDRAARARALKAAVAARQRGSEVLVLADEVLAYGTDELWYREAQRLGVLFVRPAGEPAWEGNEMTVVDAVTGEVLRVRPSAVASEGTVRDASPFVPGTVSMGPLATLRPGVLMLRANLLDGELETEARAAATLALDAARPPADRSAEVDGERCSACLTCVRTCPFGAPSMGEDGKSHIDAALCQGCGKCAAACPARAIAVSGSTDEELEARIQAALEAP